jgi:hypothetical protein
VEKKKNKNKKGSGGPGVGGERENNMRKIIIL